MIGFIGNRLPRRDFPHRKRDLELLGEGLAVQRGDPDTETHRCKQVQPDVAADRDLFTILFHWVTSPSAHQTARFLYI